MESPNSNLNTEESEANFRRLLQRTQKGQASVDELLENEILSKRLRLIVRAFAQTAEDAEELENDVRLKVWRSLLQFNPDYDRPYGNFFPWVRQIARHAYLDTLRGRRQVEVDERRVEDFDLVDPQMDIESSFLFKEVIAEFEKTINALPEREQLAITYYLQGFSSRESSEKMLQAGISVSHVTIRHWVRDALRVFLDKSGNLENIRSKNLRITKVRATRAKREFHTVLEQAINSSTPAIRPLTLAARRKTSKARQPSPRPGWQSANDLLKSMQSPESKQGINAAFEASPEALGIAAIEHANKGRKVPVGSLTTNLMAASTANVVRKVMNLTKDVT